MTLLTHIFRVQGLSVLLYYLGHKCLLDTVETTYVISLISLVSLVSLNTLVALVTLIS